MMKFLRGAAAALLLAASAAVPLAQAQSLPAASGGSRTFICGQKVAADFNSTADEAIALTGPASFLVQGVIVDHASGSLTTAQGAPLYASAAKTNPLWGTATSAYSYLNGTAGRAYLIGNGGATNSVTTQTVECANSCTVYKSLTTAQGAAMTADLTVVCYDETSPNSPY